MEPEERRLKILYLITKSNFGGAQRYVFDLAERLHRDGHDVIVGFGGEGTLALKLAEKNIRTVSLSGLGRDVALFDDVKTLFTIISLLKKEHPDILHLNSSKIGGIGGLAARLFNTQIQLARLFGGKKNPIRIIFTGHGWAMGEERPDWQRFLIATTHLATILLAHRTIAVSLRTREEVSILPFSSQKMSIIYNGIDTLTLTPKDSALEILLAENRTELLHNEPLILGTIAELHKNKGLTYALEGLAQLKKQNSQPFMFIIIGEGEERNTLEALRDTLGLTKEVFFVGFKDNASSLLSAFDVFLFTSTKEGFPYAILEAGNAGLPVIATAVGGIPEVIDDMRSGILIQSKNSGEVARAVQYLIEHNDRRIEFGKAIKKRIQGRFNLDTMMTETLLLYRSDL